MNILVSLCIALVAQVIQHAVCVNYTVIGGLPSNAFPCSEMVILKCEAKPGSVLVGWHIAYQVQTSSDVAAFCQETGCNVFNNFRGRYSFTYDKPSGISNLTISPVTSEDDKRGYICNDYTLPPLFTATVKSFPHSDTTSTQLNRDQKTVTVSTGCTLNVGDVTFSWFILKDGDRTARSHIENITAKEDACTSSSACNGTSLKSSINTAALKNISGKYSIECNILLSDPDAPGPVVKILDGVIHSAGHISQVTGLCKGSMALLSVLIFMTIYWST